MVQKLGQSTLFVKVDFKGLTSVAFTDFFTSVMAFTTKLRFVASWMTSAAAFKAIKVIKYAKKRPKSSQQLRELSVSRATEKLIIRSSAVTDL